MTKCSIDPDWKRRLQKANKEYPELKPLRKKLLEIGGAETALQTEPDLPLIMKYGELIDKPVTLKKMRTCECHTNTSRLYKAGKIDAIVTGWALSDDCVWRQHSWGLKGNRIIETTLKRKKYYGVILEGKEIEDFVTTNVMR